MLITDGFSNTGDPIPTAKVIQSQNINIITFGMRSLHKHGVYGSTVQFLINLLRR